MIKIRSTQAKSESELNEKASRMQNFKNSKSHPGLQIKACIVY